MRYQRAEQPLKLDELETARTFFASCFAESDPARECLWVAHIDAHANCLQLTRHDGGASEVGLPIRSILADATMLRSKGVLLAHNHPSGDAQPSSSDCLATRRLAATAEGLGCSVVDHFIFAGSDWSSFRQLGLL